MENTTVPKSTMRTAWFDHVRKVRKKLSKGKDNACTHRKAMAEASTTWAVEKGKIQKRMVRDARKAAREKMKVEKS